MTASAHKHIHAGYAHPDHPPQPRNKGLLVFTATYNERGNIAELCRRVLALEDRPDLLVVDDNSPDGTGALLEQLAANEPRIAVVHRPGKLGLGSAHQLAFIYAIQRGYDRLVTLDADLSHDPESIPDLLAALQDAEFVIGSRYMPGGQSDYTGYRRLDSKMANRMARLLLGIPLHEFTTSFRAFRVDLLRRVDFCSSRSKGYSFLMEGVFDAHRSGAPCAEVPIRFQDRHQGTSKIPRFEVFNGMWRLGQLFLKRFFVPHAQRSPPPLIAKPCYLCGMDTVLERARRQGPPSHDASAYRCTSMAHASKPQIVQCLTCDLVFAGDAPAPEALAALYGDVVDEKYLANKDARVRTFRQVFKSISPHLDSTRSMLEVGAYCGVFMEVAQAAGLEVVGVEPSRWAATYAREERGLDVRHGSLGQLMPQLQEKFDAVVMWDVLEHLTDPAEAMGQVHGLLNDGGLFCFSTLDIESWFPRLLGSSWPWIMDMHLFYFDKAVLTAMLNAVGFELVSVSGYRHYVSAGYLLEKGLALVARGGFDSRKTGRLARLLDVHVPVELGDIKLFVCRKVAPESGQRRLARA